MMQPSTPPTHTHTAPLLQVLCLGSQALLAPLHQLQVSRKQALGRHLNGLEQFLLRGGRVACFSRSDQRDVGKSVPFRSDVTCSGCTLKSRKAVEGGEGRFFLVRCHTKISVSSKREGARKD